MMDEDVFFLGWGYFFNEWMILLNCQLKKKNYFETKKRFEIIKKKRKQKKSYMHLENTNRIW